MRWILLFLVLFIPFVSGLHFAPASLEFDIDTGEEYCKEIFFILEGDAAVSDIWADDYSEPWSVSGFQASSGSLGLRADYPTSVSKEQEEARFCVSGSNPGEYKGALVFQQEASGSSIVQFAVWLEVLVSGDSSEEGEEEPKKSKKSGGSSSSGVVWTSASRNVVETFEDTETPEFATTSEERVVLSSLTQRKSQQNSLVPVVSIFISFVLLIVFVLILLIGRK